MAFLTPPALAGSCGEPATTSLHAAAGQADKPAVPSGRGVVVEGIVSGAFLGAEQLDGFFLQSRGPAADGKPSGLFVYAPELTPKQRQRVEPGQHLRVEGELGTHRGRRQVEWVEAVHDCGPAEGGRPAYELTWPVPEPQRLEGVHVAVTSTMAVTGNASLARYGTLALAPARRAYQPANFLAGEGPQAPALRGQRLLMDDGSYRSEPEPIPYLNAEGTRRVGATVEELRGVLTRAFDAWRLHPTEPPGLQPSNPRPEPLAEPGKGVVRIAAFNVEGYFLTLGERGAETAAQLRRQRSKLLAAVERLAADILVLVEVENRLRAAADLVERLASATAEPWRLAHGGDAGDDAIRVALAYRADRVAPVTGVIRDRRRVHHRPPVVAGFRASAGGAPFAVAGVHLKSRLACPEAGDVDRGQGCWNERRTEQAKAVAKLIQAFPERGAGSMPALLAGDLNAYAAEDPVRALAEAGMVDLLAEHTPWRQRYSYVYRGKSGYLDHLQAQPRLAERVEAVYTYPINADEPPFLAFDAEAPAAPEAQASAFRASDHDPVVVDLRVAPE